MAEIAAARGTHNIHAAIKGDLILYFDFGVEFGRRMVWIPVGDLVLATLVRVP